MGIVDLQDEAGVRGDQAGEAAVTVVLVADQNHCAVWDVGEPGVVWIQSINGTYLGP